MASPKHFNLPPVTICIYILVAIISSSIWLTGFTIQIKNTQPPNHLRTLLLQSLLTIIYIIHLAFTFCIPICSRPWLWTHESKKSSDFLEIFMIVMGWDDCADESWKIGGARGTIAFVLGITPFLLPIERSGWVFLTIVAMAFESFFLAEIVKHTEMEEGVFYTTMAGATAATRRIFGYSSPHMVFVLLLCVALIFLHSFLPFYDKDEHIFSEDFTDGYSSVPDFEEPVVVAGEA